MYSYSVSNCKYSGHSIADQNLSFGKFINEAIQIKVGGFCNISSLDLGHRSMTEQVEVAR